MPQRLRFLIYLPPVILFVLLKQWRTTAEVGELKFLLLPTSWLVAAMRSSNYEWVANSGYYFQAENFIINAACAGFTFFLLCFIALFLALPKTRLRWWTAIPCLLFAWPLTVMVNASRILGLHYSNSLGLSGATFHELIGAFIYFFFLTGIFVVARQLTGPKLLIS